MKLHSLILLLALVAGCVAPAAETTELPSLPGDVAATAWEVAPLLPGMDAPAVALTRADGTPWTLDPTTMERPLVLTFYRGGWCPYCNRHLAAFRNAETELLSKGFEVVFASADRPEALEPSLGDSTYRHTLVSDQDLTASRAFGIAYKVDDATVERYEGTHMDLDEASGRDHHWLPAPATYIVTTDGVIQFGYVNPNYRVRVSPEVVLAAAADALEVEAKLQEG